MFVQLQLVSGGMFLMLYPHFLGIFGDWVGGVWGRGMG